MGQAGTSNVGPPPKKKQKDDARRRENEIKGRPRYALAVSSNVDKCQVGKRECRKGRYCS